MDWSSTSPAERVPDASFDAAFSIFGVVMFPDWCRGLAEMARVTRPDGHVVVATWQDRGAATFLLLGQFRQRLFPRLKGMTMPDGIRTLGDPANFAQELMSAGLSDPQIAEATHDYELNVELADPDTLF